MLRERIEQIKQEYTDQYVVIEGPPEMAQLLGRVGQVKTINMNGLALVQFEDADKSWHDVELDYIKVVDKPEPKPEPAKGKAGKKAPAKGSTEKQAAKIALSAMESSAGLSRLEIARAEQEALQKAQEESENTATEEQSKGKEGGKG